MWFDYAKQKLREIRGRWPDLGRERLLTDEQIKAMEKPKPKAKLESNRGIKSKPLTYEQQALLDLLNPWAHDKRFGYAEAAACLGRTVDAVKHMMSRIKKRNPEAYADYVRVKKGCVAGQEAVRSASRLPMPELIHDVRNRVSLSEVEGFGGNGDANPTSLSETDICVNSANNDYVAKRRSRDIKYIPVTQEPDDTDESDKSKRIDAATKASALYRVRKIF